MAEAAPGCKRLCGPACALALLVALMGCPRGTAPIQRHTAPDVSVAAPQAPLQRALAQVIQPLSTTGASVGLVVLDGVTGEVLANHRATELFTPASTVKLITTAAVLHHLDAALRFNTSLQSAEPTADGTVPGNLYLVGGGDPSFGSARFLPGSNPNEPAPWDLFPDVATAMARSGVTRINGAVVGDHRVLHGCGLLPGWAWDDAAYGYSALPCGLTLHEGLTWVRTFTSENGLLGILTPPTSEVRLTVERGPVDGRGLDLTPDGERVRVTWRGPDPVVMATEPVGVQNPPRYAAEQLSRALYGAGIRVEQGHRTALATDVADTTHTWFSVQSPPLRELCGATNQQSINLYAEMLLMQLGRLTGEEPSTRGGLVAVNRFLRQAGVDPASLRLVDGSGLSRMDLVAPMHLALAARSAWLKDPSFVELLSTAGNVGTFEKRLLGTAAEGRVHVKTGTLTGHRNVVGMVQTLQGRWLMVAVMVGGLVVPRAAVDGMVDRVLLTLVTSSF